MTFSGPSADLWERYSRATNAPVIMALGPAGVTALNERVVKAREFEDLAPADRALVEKAELEISAGLSPTLQDPSDWQSDWAAEDAADDARQAREGKALPTVDDDAWVGL